VSRLVPFDLDGTFVDSSPGIHASVRAAAAAHPGGRDPVLVGDRARDVLGAAARGLPCIGAGWGPAEPGELEDAGAAVVVATPAEVLTVLDRKIS
jgi:phosphoglycolate phosphatase